MQRWLLAAGVLLAGAFASARADYVVIIANLAQNNAPPGPPGQAPGGPGGAMFGGPGGMMGGAPGMAPPGGPGGMMGGIPPGGMRGGYPGPMPPGMAPGMGPGMAPGMEGMPGAEAEEEDVPYPIVAVLEVEPTKAGNYLKRFDDEKFPPLLRSVKMKTRWGGVLTVVPRTGFSRAIILKTPDGKALPSVARRYKQEFDRIFKDKPTVEQVLELAHWTLQHGLVEKFPEVMDKLVEQEKDNKAPHQAITAYRKVKEALARKPQDPSSEVLRARLLDGYHLSTDDQHHYALLHYSASADVGEVSPHLDQLEHTFRAFYYWFALRGKALAVPVQRQLAVLAATDKDYERLQKVLAAGPQVGEGFFAPREHVVVLSAQRRDQSYDTLQMVSKPLWEAGFNRKDLVTGHSKIRNPVLLQQSGLATYCAILLKALEDESERVTISHDASRQMLYTVGLLPGNVTAPEWLLFGMGSFFELPPESPWGGPGAPSSYYLPRFKDLKKDGLLEKSPLETLRKVVTDSYFRQPHLGESPEEAQQRARAAAWSLTYFLAQKKLDGLFTYFDELSRMPRDLELGEEALFTSFARAFNAIDKDGKPDLGRLGALANQWYNYIDVQTLEAQAIHDAIRDFYKEVATARTLATAAGGTNPQTGVRPNSPQTNRPRTGSGMVRPRTGSGARPRTRVIIRRQTTPVYRPRATPTYRPRRR